MLVALNVAQITYADRRTMPRLKDCAIKVCNEKHKQAICEMFTIQSKFATDCLNLFKKKTCEKLES